MRWKGKDNGAIMSEVLTLRLTPEEMLRLKLAALQQKRKRAVIVRERVADLIRPPAAATSQEEGEIVAREAGGISETVACGNGGMGIAVENPVSEARTTACNVEGKE